MKLNSPLRLIRQPLARRSIVAALVSSLLLGSTGIVLLEGPARADSVDDAKRKVRQVADQLQAAEDEVDRLSVELTNVEDDQAQLAIEIAASEAEVAVKETQLGGLQGQMTDLAVEAFIGGGRGGSISGLLAPGGGPNESVQRQYLTSIALNVGLSDSDQLDALITDLNDLQRKLEKDRGRAEKLATQISSDSARTEEKIAKFIKFKASAEKELGQALSAEQARRAAAAAAASRAEAAAQASSRGEADAGGGSSDSREPFDPSTLPPSSSRGAVAVAAAISQIGVPYIRYKSIEGVGFDCSGLTAYAWAQAGISIPHQSRQQFGTTTHIPVAYMEPGDLVYFYSPITHVGIYIGGGMMVDAPGVGRFVRYASVTYRKIVGVSRPG